MQTVTKEMYLSFHPPEKVPPRLASVYSHVLYSNLGPLCVHAGVHLFTWHLGLRCRERPGDQSTINGEVYLVQGVIALVRSRESQSAALCPPSPGQGPHLPKATAAKKNSWRSHYRKTQKLHQKLSLFCLTVIQAQTPHLVLVINSLVTANRRCLGGAARHHLYQPAPGQPGQRPQNRPVSPSLATSGCLSPALS